MRFKAYDTINKKLLDLFKIILAHDGEVVAVEDLNGESYGLHQVDLMIDQESMFRAWAATAERIIEKQNSGPPNWYKFDKAPDGARIAIAEDGAKYRQEGDIWEEVKEKGDQT